MLTKEDEKVIERELYDINQRVFLNSRREHNQNPTDIQEHPDAKKHQTVSFIKSGIRILGYILIPFSLPWAAGILVVSEVVGIIEELV